MRKQALEFSVHCYSVSSWVGAQTGKMVGRVEGEWEASALSIS